MGSPTPNDTCLSYHVRLRLPKCWKGPSREMHAAMEMLASGTLASLGPAISACPQVTCPQVTRPELLSREKKIKENAFPGRKRR
jgi:hypothetical protein